MNPWLASVAFASAAWIVGTVFAWVEIEIEGPFAWSRDNPHTWRWQLAGICGNRLPLTGYHLTMFLTVFLLPYGAYAVLRSMNGDGVDWSDMFTIGAYYTLLVLIEDAQWYVYNMEFNNEVNVINADNLELQTRDPFGGTCNRVSRYLMNFIVFVVCWSVQLWLREDDHSLRTASIEWFAVSGWSNDSKYVFTGCLMVLVIIATSAGLFLLQIYTIVPGYKWIRRRLVEQDTSLKEMNYKIKKTCNGKILLEYYVVPNKDNATASSVQSSYAAMNTTTLPSRNCIFSCAALPLSTHA